MATTTEYGAVLDWARAKMLADATIATTATGIYNKLAPDGAVSPYIIIQPMSLMDTLTANDYRVYQNGLWLFKAVGKVADYDKIVALNVRLDALFGKTIDADANATYLICHREGEVNLPPVVIDGDQWEQYGQQVRIGAQLK